MAQQIFILRDPLRCSGCRLCEVACSLHHEGTVWPEASRIRVFELYPGVDVPQTCAQCRDYPCVKACGQAALRVDEKTGAVIVDEAKCTGCGDCVRACPGKVMRLHPKTGKAMVCDLCGGEPECVKACQDAGFHALQVVPYESVALKIYSIFPEEVARRLHETLYGGEEVFLG
ncbi:4Fe-4S dicluster domain-containing protein [Infirmifilum sp.]|uniref:4Fe-4S dicluster domain-containing protein n=1 Tax=Infirmifilum sp. TaxID=2856575 RepID=UPI003D0E5F3B